MNIVTDREMICDNCGCNDSNTYHEVNNSLLCTKCKDRPLVVLFCHLKEDKE